MLKKINYQKLIEKNSGYIFSSTNLAGLNVSLLSIIIRINKHYYHGSVKNNCFLRILNKILQNNKIFHEITQHNFIHYRDGNFLCSIALTSNPGEVEKSKNMDVIKKDLKGIKKEWIETYQIDEKLYVVKRISILNLEKFPNLHIKNLETKDEIIGRIGKFENLDLIIKIIEKDNFFFEKEEIEPHFHLFSHLDAIYIENVITGRVMEDKEKYQKVMNIIPETYKNKFSNQEIFKDLINDHNEKL